MARNTNTQLRGSLLYCVYLRSYGQAGNFAGLQRDLDRIRALGADSIWLLPIHPIGQKNRKGSLGSPYAIQDYRAINPEYGTLEDFKALLAAIHARGMKCLIDVVYNHTAWDSVLAQTHPEWFYKTPEGAFGNRAGDWSDVIDLDYSHSDLWDYQIETLAYWASLGVDGFRCDVASAVPVEFWCEARRRLEAAKPGMVWLAESVHPWFVRRQRQNGFGCHSDAELYQAFDITYDYDIHDWYAGIFTGQATVADWLREMQAQQVRYPENFIKLRFLENHDQPRVAALLPDAVKRHMWLAFTLFAQGTALIYAGQETDEVETPSLFERAPVEFDKPNPQTHGLLLDMARLRHLPPVADGRYSLSTPAENPGVALAQYEADGQRLVGVFNLPLCEGEVSVPLPDGAYENLLGKQPVRVAGGRMRLSRQPVLVRLAA